MKIRLSIACCFLAVPWVGLGESLPPLPENPFLEGPPQFEVAYEQAAKAYRDHRFDVAYQSFRQLQQRRPDDPAVNLGLGYAAAAVGDVQQAAEAYERALRSYRDTPRARVALARMYLAIGDFERARPHIERALEMSPSDEAKARIRRQLDRIVQFRPRDPAAATEDATEGSPTEGNRTEKSAPADTATEESAGGEVVTEASPEEVVGAAYEEGKEDVTTDASAERVLRPPPPLREPAGARASEALPADGSESEIDSPAAPPAAASARPLFEIDDGRIRWLAAQEIRRTRPSIDLSTFRPGFVVCAKHPTLTEPDMIVVEWLGRQALARRKGSEPGQAQVQVRKLEAELNRDGELRGIRDATTWLVWEGGPSEDRKPPRTGDTLDEGPRTARRRVDRFELTPTAKELIEQRYSLLLRKEVQAELGITSDQLDEIRKGFETTSPRPPLSELLEPRGMDRLNELVIQLRGPILLAVLDALAEAVELTPAQRAEIRNTVREHAPRIQAPLTQLTKRVGRDPALASEPSPEAPVRALIDETIAEVQVRDQAILDLLTPLQRERFTELQGEPLALEWDPYLLARTP